MKTILITALFILSVAAYASEQEFTDRDFDREAREAYEEHVITNMLFAKEELLYVEPSDDEEDYRTGIVPAAEAEQK